MTNDLSQTTNQALLIIHGFLTRFGNFNCSQISDQQFAALFEGLKSNTNLESLSLCNTGLTDRTGVLLADALAKNSTLRTIK